MYKLKIKKDNHWKWLQGNIYKIQLVDSEKDASIFDEDEMKWFKTLNIDKPSNFDYEILA